MLFLLLALLLPSLCSIDQRPFHYDKYLHEQVAQTSADPSSAYVYRRYQIYQESGDNPRATSDFAGWKKMALDTATAVRKGFGAAGLTQFIWPTAEQYGAQTISTHAASDTVFASDIYNPYWSMSAMCAYMKTIRGTLLCTTNSKARRNLMGDRKFLELCSLAGYNAGEGRVLKLLKKHSSWRDLRTGLPLETRNYAENIVRAKS